MPKCDEGVLIRRPDLDREGLIALEDERGGVVYLGYLKTFELVGVEKEELPEVTITITARPVP
jgi:hypothetical protein